MENMNFQNSQPKSDRVLNPGTILKNVVRLKTCSVKVETKVDENSLFHKICHFTELTNVGNRFAIFKYTNVVHKSSCTIYVHFGLFIFSSNKRRTRLIPLPFHSFPRSPRHNWATYHIVWRAFLFHIDISPTCFISHRLVTGPYSDHF